MKSRGLLTLTEASPLSQVVPELLPAPAGWSCESRAHPPSSARGWRLG
jgi:hypothetical protein